MISVIIPAHDESSVIERSLRAITTGAEPGELEVVVVCNGCTDNTAALARRFGAPVRVVETEVASKSHALNLGDQVAVGFPRVYVDADVVITLDAIRALGLRLEQGDVLAVAPTAKIDVSGCTWPVRATFQIKSALPSAHEGIGGSGVYALSAVGRRRFGAFPDLIADDGYVRVQFRPEERDTLTTAISTVFPPRNLRKFFTTRTRVHYGSFELARLYPDLWNNRGESNCKRLMMLFGQPRLWPKLVVYCGVTLLCRHRAQRQIRRGHVGWHRDESSRGVPDGKGAGTFECY